jgi:leader peptidase (prepilin peptidase) / N-methyltransferase
MPIIYIWVGAILGWVAGSLVNYLGDVLPETRHFSQPYCTRCGKPMKWWNYITWRACMDCHAKRPLRDWLVQLFFIVAISFLWIHPSTRLGFWIGSLLLIYFGVVFIIDLEHRLVLHQVSIVGGILGLLIGFWLHNAWQTIAGGAAGFGIMLALYYLGEVYARWMARRRRQALDEVALGYGDVNLSGVLGLILGWPGIIAGLVFAILAGGIVSLGYIIFLLIAKKYKPFTAIPYAPFLLFGATILLYVV